jgi:hypothetical protein
MSAATMTISHVWSCFCALLRHLGQVSAASNFERATMNETERAVLRLFRTYRMEPNQILCLHAGLFKTDRQQFSKAIRSLIDHEMLVKESFRDAYSLTTRGYVASLSA